MHYKTTKMSLFSNTIDEFKSIIVVIQAVIIFLCNYNYIGKKAQTLHERTEENTYSNKRSNEQRTLIRGATNKLQFMNFCQLASIIVT